MIVPPIAVWKYSTLPELFTQYFLTEGIQDTDEWQACIHQSEAFEAFTDGVRQSYGSLGHTQAPYEAQTTGKAIIRRMVLKRLLGGGVSEHEETYDLNWLGKRRALRLINKGCWQQMHSGLD